MKKNNCQKKNRKKESPFTSGRGWPGHQMERGIKDGFVRGLCVYAEPFGSCVGAAFCALCFAGLIGQKISNPNGFTA